MEMHGNIQQTFFHKILIIDIETVPLFPQWSMLPDGLKAHWQHKMKLMNLDEEYRENFAAVYQDRAGIYAEFGKIICIGMGFLTEKEGFWSVRLRSIQAHDEADLLKEFCVLLNRFISQNKEIIFCGHNIKEFDIPYICRRMLINGIPLPSVLDISGKKPWQLPYQDTLDLWRFGDYKNYSSLDLLAQVLQVPSSKSDIDGSQVASVYWEEKDLDRIAQYCLRDVFTTTLVYLKLKGWTHPFPEPVYV
jgi:DNA polymerase elongation subunit (family B)